MPGADTSDAESLRAQLQRILASEVFAGAPVLARFLRYVVEHRICGAGTPLKEYTIGVDVFDRGTDFDPRVDTIVRVHARRLRKRLDRYYESAGCADAIRISVPKGHYQTEVALRTPPRPVAAGPAPDQLVAAEPGRWRSFRSSVIPAPRTPLVGRAGEVAELRDLLTDDDGPRLVTLTGAAGSGKTRLAIQVGLQLQEACEGDVAFVRLASVADGRTLEMALLRALGLRVVDQTPPLEVICNHLHDAGRVPPLILDNFEQLASAAPVIGSLLDSSISLRVLVTSRVALHLYGECEYPVLPLALPESDSMPLAELAGVPAVDLFVQRAAAVHPGFALTLDNAEAVARLCRRFDGLPLGIELAAAQCRTMTPAQLLERFPERLDLPAGNLADVPDRQRSLRRAIEWSHELLAAPERMLYRRLAVFVGGFSLEAAEAVANVRDDPGIDVPGGVARLLDNNLLETAPDAGEPRFTMLETIREYAIEQLAASGERDEIRKAHAAYCVVLAEEGGGRLDARTREQWLARCDREHDNFLAALDGLVERGDGQWALRLARALFRYWEQREQMAVAQRTLVVVLERFEASVDPVLWAQVCCCLGAMEARMGQQEEADVNLWRGLAVARQCGDETVLMMALTSLGLSESVLHRYQSAADLYEECLRLCRASGRAREAAAAMSNLATAKLAMGEHDKARDLLERALAAFEHQEEWTPAAWCINQLGDVAVAAGRYDDARAFYQQSAQRFVQLGNLLGIARCWTDLGHLALQRGEYARAASLFADALEINKRQGFQRGVANLIEGCAALEVARQHHEQGLVLAGAAEAMREVRRMYASPPKRARLERVLEPAREALTPAQVEACHRRGTAMDVHAAVKYLQQCLARAESDAPDA